jgi:hypothetical protein
MRAIAQRFVDDVEAAHGTPEESAVVDTARTGLEDALAWVTGAGSEVLTAAPSLDDDIQVALDGLSSSGGGTMTAIGRAYESWVLTRASQCEEGVGCVNPHVYTDLPVDTPVPFSLVSPAATFVVSQPASNVVVVDASVIPPRGWGGALVLEFFSSTPGHVSVHVHPEWLTSPTGAVCPVVFPSPAEPTPGAILSVQIIVAENHCPGGFGDIAGSGPLVTFTFTPAP